MKGTHNLVIILISVLFGTTVLLFQNCSGFLGGQGTSSSASNVGSASLSHFPENFGTSHQMPFYNPKGEIQSVLSDGGDHALELGIKTIKIHLSRGSLISGTNTYFYRLPESEIQGIATLKDAVNSPSIKAFLDKPFKTIFIDADNIALEGRTPIIDQNGNPSHNNYWEFDRVAMQERDKQAVYQETYDMAIALLTNYGNVDKTFIIQNHEGDSHATPQGTPHALPSDVGLQNFKDYWSVRQRAIEDARRDRPSRSKIYHMCEVVSVKRPMRATLGSDEWRSLSTLVLPEVACDLVGYSAHDTAIDGDGGLLLSQAVEFLRNTSATSPTFGRNHIVISEIAVPEELNGYYLPQLDRVADQIVQFLKEGMPWVVYWQLYDNSYDGNQLVTRDGQTSKMYKALERRFSLENSAKQRDEIIQSIRDLSIQYFGQISTNDAAVSLQLELAMQEGSLDTIHDYFSWIKSTWVKHYGSVPDYSYVDGGMTYLIGGFSHGGGDKNSLERLIQDEANRLNGMPSSPGGNPADNPGDGSTGSPPSQACTDRNYIPSSDQEALPLGVIPEVKRTYWELLGGIGEYLEGARVITRLRSEGFTLQSLRRDIIRDPAVANKINFLYRMYLGRDAEPQAMSNSLSFLENAGTIRTLELNIVNSPECRSR